MDKTTAGPGLFEGANNGADGLKVWSTALVGKLRPEPPVRARVCTAAYGTGGRTRVDGHGRTGAAGEAEDET